MVDGLTTLPKAMMDCKVQKAKARCRTKILDYQLVRGRQSTHHGYLTMLVGWVTRLVDMMGFGNLEATVVPQYYHL